MGKAMNNFIPNYINFKFQVWHRFDKFQIKMLQKMLTLGNLKNIAVENFKICLLRIINEEYRKIKK